MYYVYLLQSQSYPKQSYTGYTTDLKQRLKDHNAEKSLHTKKYAPWDLVTYLAFSDKRVAQEFEYYLKTASGRAFANKRLGTNK